MGQGLEQVVELEQGLEQEAVWERELAMVLKSMVVRHKL